MRVSQVPNLTLCNDMCVLMQVHIAYQPGHSDQPVPSDQIQALVKTCSRRLQIQERLTQEIADGVTSLTGASQSLMLFYNNFNL